MKSINLRECENAWYTFWVRPDRTQATPIVWDPLSILIWSKNCPKVAELSLDQIFDADEESCQKHTLKMNNPQVMIQKPFAGLVTGPKYDYSIFFKNMGKFGLF